MDDNSVLLELKQIIEHDKVFIGSEFISYYARCVFGKKPTPDIASRATLLAKEFKTFLTAVELKEQKLNISFFNINKIQLKLLKCIHKTFRDTTKIIDGDMCLEEFKKQIVKDDALKTTDAVSEINKIIYQELLNSDILSAIDTKFRNRKCIFEALSKHHTIMDFILSGYKSSNSIEDYLETFNKILSETLAETTPIGDYGSKVVLMSDQTFDEIAADVQTKYHLSTGYYSLDYVFNGGFETGRLYVVGGLSGGGKSLVAGNLAYNTKLALDKEPGDSPSKSAVLYLTLENSAEETRFRIMCAALNCSKGQIYGSKQVDDNNKFREDYSKIFNNPNKTEFIICWQPAGSMDTTDLMFLINDLSRRYNRTIRFVVVDYADKLVPNGETKSGTEWIDIGTIFDELKNLSVTLDIPILTMSQINRSGYGNKNSDGPSGANIAGSIRKRENTDVLLIFDFNNNSEEIVLDSKSIKTLKVDALSRNVPVFCRVDKNRDGMRNVKLQMYVDYPCYSLKDEIDNPEESNKYFSKAEKEEQEEKPTEAAVNIGDLF